ncbi:MAG: hypothetical protein ACLSUW_06470 [Akkermansia sp.]
MPFLDVKPCAREGNLTESAMRLFMMFCVMLLLAGCDTRTSVERAQEAGVLIVGNNAEPQSFDPTSPLPFPISR